jgi:acetate kinase
MHRCSLDALVFSGEIGWDQHEIRHEICAGLALLGVTIPVSGNREQDGPVSPDAAVPVLVVQTPRGMQLARDATTALG